MEKVSFDFFQGSEHNTITTPEDQGDWVLWWEGSVLQIFTKPQSASNGKECFLMADL